MTAERTAQAWHCPSCGGVKVSVDRPTSCPNCPQPPAAPIGVIVFSTLVLALIAAIIIWGLAR